jgi:hypothetical protein
VQPDTLAAALAGLPGRFRRHSCYVILPKIHPLHKCIIHHPVSPDLRRIMLTEAIEMDLPIKAEAFAWDFFPLHAHATDERFLSYVFAERWHRVDPIFDAFLQAKIYPKGALVPLAIEFFSALAKGDGNSLQLCIDETTTSLIFTGGERPYVHSLPYGWDRVLQNEDAEDQWNDWVKSDGAGNEVLSERVNEFFRELAAEIHKCELYYFHHLQGHPYAQMAVHSGRSGSGFWIKFLEKRLTHKVDVIHANEGWECSGEMPDEITRMHLFRGAEMLFNGSMDNPAAVVSPVVVQRERQSKRFVAKVAACTAACGGLLLGDLYGVLQNRVLQQNLAHLRQKTEEERVTAVAAGRLDGEAERYRVRLERANKVYSCQTAWAALFQELEDILVSGENGWLDELRVMPPGGNGPREITIGGSILAGEGEEVSSKFRQFLGQLQKSPVVGSLGNLTLAEAHQGMQPFQCTIALITKYF